MTDWLTDWRQGWLPGDTIASEKSNIKKINLSQLARPLLLRPTKDKGTSTVALACVHPTLNEIIISFSMAIFFLNFHCVTSVTQDCCYSINATKNSSHNSRSKQTNATITIIDQAYQCPWCQWPCYHLVYHIHLWSNPVFKITLLRSANIQWILFTQN